LKWPSDENPGAIFMPSRSHRLWETGAIEVSHPSTIARDD